ncbi:MAG: YIP1 family protein [Chloroflexi bacterium]|nr:YIP1 family protein [Chloroflexota bacterium]
METAAPSPTITDRMLRAARLDVGLYEEVEADIRATNQALLVVVIVAIAAGIGAALGGGNVVGRLVAGILNALIGWAVWSYVVYFVGTRFMGGTATYGELLRTLGFAETPGILAIFGFIPILGGILALIGGIWTLVASFIATRQALDIDNGKTIITILLAILALFIVVLVVSIIVGIIFGIGFAVGSMVSP